MPRVLVSTLTILALFLSVTALAQESLSNPVDVAYVLEDSTKLGERLLTYDVDRNTGYPTPKGQPLLLPPPVTTSARLNFDVVTPAPDGHFLYVLGNTNSINQVIWVYATDSFGVPQGSPIQTVPSPLTYYFQIDPNGKLAYALAWGLGDGNQYRDVPLNIRVFNVDPHTGFLSKTSRIVQAWGEYGPCGSGTLAYPFLNGFNPEGSELYGGWSCTYQDTYGAYYYSSAVDAHTGQLGQPQEIFNWRSSGGSGDFIFLTARLMIDFYNNGGYGWSAVNIYPLTGGSNPLISCTETMLQACGDAIYVAADPEGEYLFLQSSANVVEVAKIDLATKTIVDTGNSFPQPVLTMSPDRHLIYTQAPHERGPNVVGIYVFDSQTGAVQQGGEFGAGDYGYEVIPAVRQ